MAGIALKSCQLRIKCKVGTTASGSDSTNTISYNGVNQGCDADSLWNTCEAIQSLRSIPALEYLRRDENLISDQL